MKRIQIVVRDIYGRVAYNEISPNLPMALIQLATVIDNIAPVVGQVRLVQPDPKEGLVHKVFRLYPGAEGRWVLKNRKGEMIMVPAIEYIDDPIDEELDDLDDLGDEAAET